MVIALGTRRTNEEIVETVASKIESGSLSSAQLQRAADEIREWIAPGSDAPRSLSRIEYSLSSVERSVSRPLLERIAATLAVAGAARNS